MTSALAIRDEQDSWSPEQVAALHQLGVKDASDGDLKVFFHQSVRSGLDPFAKQIYMIGRSTFDSKKNRWEVKQTIQTGIDGFRLIARRAVDRTGETLGYEDTLWASRDGIWSSVWLSDEPPAAAKVVVLRNGQRFPAVAVYREYVQTTNKGVPNSMWSRMPANQLAKCAEALALRKAFPQDLSGLYTDDEMGQADGQVGAADPVPGVADNFHGQAGETEEEFHERKRKRMFALFNEMGIKDRKDQVAYIEFTLGRELGSRANMTTEDFIKVIEDLEAEQRTQQTDEPAAAVEAEVVDGPMFPEGVDETTGEVQT